MRSATLYYTTKEGGEWIQVLSSNMIFLDTDLIPTKDFLKERLAVTEIHSIRLVSGHIFDFKLGRWFESSNPEITFSNPIEQILAERGSRYGSFLGHACITQSLKDTMRDSNNWSSLTSSQREALEMVAHKIGRILNGDPNYLDSWVDIVGYTQLIVDQLNGKNT